LPRVLKMVNNLVSREVSSRDLMLASEAVSELILVFPLIFS
jgi:hypothetical protein